jgi:hypothetical protein
MKLYEITEELSALERVLEENEGEADTEILSILENLNLEFNEKVTNIVKFIKNNDAEIEALRNEEKRLAKKRKALENKNSWLKDYIKMNMEKNEITKVKDEIFSISLRNTQPKLLIFNEQELMNDTRFIRIKEELDKTAIRDAIKSGQTVNGAELVENKALYIR